MAFASGPVSFQRFFVTGSIPSDVTDRFIEAVNTHAFGKAPAAQDDVQLGWIGPGHLFETEIVAEPVAYGRFAHLAVRIDRLGAPSNVLTAYVRMEEQAALEAGGREFLSRGEKKKARARALDRARGEARAGGFRRMNAYPLLIDLEGRTVFLGNLGTSIADKVGQLFSDTFGCALEPADVDRLTLRLIGSQRDGRTLEQIAPFHLVRPPEGRGEPADGFRGGDLRFLGREFLTWLWHQVDADDGALRVQSGDEVHVMIDRTLRLKCDFGLTGVDVITADGPASLPEARAALGIGKQPTKMGLIIGGAPGEFRLTLDGERLAVSSLILPEDRAEQDPRARLEGRFEAVADLASVIDGMFELFLQHRTSRTWSAELGRMSAWAAGRAEKTRVHAASA